MVKVGVVGLGYVGIPVAVLAAEKGYDVVGIDLDESKIEAINAGKSPMADEKLEKALVSKPFKASTDYADIADADIVVIAVPTPVKDELPDLTILKAATTATGENLQDGALLIIESTINPGVCDDALIPLLAEMDLTEGSDYHMAHCPERISPGDEWDLKDINRVVGSNSEEGLNRALEFYNKLLDADVKPMGSIKEAEAVKVVENSFRDINIAFVNELAMSFDLMGINLENVIDGASSKPFGYMPFRPGPGVGGHCIPVDPHYLIEYAKTFGFEHRFMRLARDVNKAMPGFVVDVTRRALEEKDIKLEDAKVALFGLSYKPNVDDLRESPSLEILDQLKEMGVEVVVYDPYHVKDDHAESIDDALGDNVDALILATHHDDYKELSPETMKKHGVSVFVDSRNMFKDTKQDFKDAGVLYRGVGQS